MEIAFEKVGTNGIHRLTARDGTCDLHSSELDLHDAGAVDIFAAAVEQIIGAPGVADGIRERVAEQLAKQNRPQATLDELRSANIRAFAHSDGEDGAAAAPAWPDPSPLPSGLPPVLPFDFDLLPMSLRGWVTDISERMQCPPDYVAATAIIVAGSLIGRSVSIRPKRHDNWSVVPNLYGAMIGRPSLMKSPAIHEALKPLDRLEIEAKQDYEKALAEHAAAEMVADAKTKLIKEQVKKAVKEGVDATAIAAELVTGGDDVPSRRRYRVNDTTVEKLGVILAENPNGVLLFNDELVTLLRTMERDGHESDRGFYLCAWAGTSRYTYDRIGRGTLDIEAAIVSIVGSIQPGVIAEYLRAAVNGGHGDDGLMPRFQMTVWPDAPAAWRNVDRYPDSAAKDAAYQSLRRLVGIAPLDVGAEFDGFDPDAIPYLRFDSDAQEAFDVWRTELENQLRSGAEHPAVESHLAKYRSLIPSLALIMHLLDGHAGPIGLPTVLGAIGWGRYLESHARRLYASVTDAPAAAARLLAARIQKQDIPADFAGRDIYRMGWSGLDRDQATAAIDVLLSLNWVAERIEQTGGRSKTRYAANPKIFAQTELTKPTEGAFVSNVSSSICPFSNSSSSISNNSNAPSKNGISLNHELTKPTEGGGL